MINPEMEYNIKTPRYEEIIEHVIREQQSKTPESQNWENINLTIEIRNIRWKGEEQN